MCLYVWDKIINAEHICINNFVMACYRAISSTANKLKIISICSGLYKDFAPMYYNDKVDAIIYIFVEYINLYIN